MINMQQESDARSESSSLAGKVALIAGKKAETLSAVATQVASKGADVALIYECENDIQTAWDIKEQVESQNVKFALICTDWEDESEVDQIISYTTAVLGKPEIFIDLTPSTVKSNAAGSGVLSNWMMTRAIMQTID